MPSGFALSGREVTIDEGNIFAYYSESFVYSEARALEVKSQKCATFILCFPCDLPLVTEVLSTSNPMKAFCGVRRSLSVHFFTGHPAEVTQVGPDLSVLLLME